MEVDDDLYIRHNKQMFTKYNEPSLSSDCLSGSANIE